MGRSPYTPEWRAKVSQEYLDGKAPLSDIAKRYGVHKETIRCWAKRYQEQGMSAFERGSGYTAYTVDFKMKCVELCISGKMSRHKIVAKYNISDCSVLNS